MHPENFQLKPTLLDFRTKINVLDVIGCILHFLHPKARNCTPLNSKTYFCSHNFFVSEYDSFRFSLILFASFWAPFVEPGAAPPVHAKIGRTKLLRSTSRILC